MPGDFPKVTRGVFASYATRTVRVWQSHYPIGPFMNAERFCQACNRETSQHVVRRGPHAGWWCGKCKNICTDSPLWLSDSALHAMGLTRAQLPDAPATTLQLPLPNVEGKRNPACRRCGVTARLETHHWAPRSVFGEDADRWPTDDLCVACHQEWHAKMHDHARRGAA